MTEDRLLHSLLDRLTDDEPGVRQESRDSRVLSLSRYREAVIRDLGWLFNTGRLGDVQDLSAFPQVASSVVNFGLPDLAGRTASSLDLVRLERLLREAITAFEPRVLPDSLEIRAVKDKDLMSRNAVQLEIRAAVWAQPLTQEVFLRTDLDLETGEVAVRERRGG
jgi:type VI secretion system protein ImpF